MAHSYFAKILCRRYSKKIAERHGSRVLSHIFAEDMNPGEMEESQDKASRNDDQEAKQTPAKPRAKHLMAVHTGQYNPAMEHHIKAAVEVGYKCLEETGKSLEAVEAACRFMESNAAFNCGKGSALTTLGVVEMEASVMDGETLKSGAVSGLNNIEHPVTLARMVMDKTPHIAICGQGSNHFAQSLGFPRIHPHMLITDEVKEAHSKDNQDHPGVAAAMALDPEGNLATAMSTGGMRKKLPGTVGCCAIVGTGYFADNNIAAVTTCDNGAILKANLAFDIVHVIGQGMPPLEAAQKMLLKLQLRMYTKGGVMLITKNGDVGIALTDDKMEWAFKRSGEFKSGNTEGFYEYKA